MLIYQRVNYCDLCGSTESTNFLANRDRCFNLPGYFKLAECRQCNLVRLYLRPANNFLNYYYPENQYYSYSPPEDSLPTRRNFRLIRDLLRNLLLRELGYPVYTPLNLHHLRVSSFIPKRLFRRATFGKTGFPHYVPNGKALDIGCGYGLFLHYLKLLGWDVLGIDNSPQAAKTAKKLFSINVITGELEKIDLKETNFNFINLSHIIEHVQSPTKFLTKVKEHLANDGLAYIETPNIDSFAFDHCRQYWYPLETPRHLWLFSPKTLTELINKCGLAVQSLKTMPFVGNYRWYYTYKKEESTKRISDRRPLQMPNTLFKAAAYSVREELHLFRYPKRGAIISCWVKQR